MICPEHNIQMIRRPSKFSKSFWWGCPKYPACKFTAAEHPDGSVMSTPANEEVKALRTKAHRIAEEIWGKWDSRKCKKTEMYDWLKYNSKSGHFGLMQKDELTKTIEKLEVTLRYKNV